MRDEKELMECPECGGTGWHQGKLCGVCGGEGEVNWSQEEYEEWEQEQYEASYDRWEEYWQGWEGHCRMYEMYGRYWE